jgi:hypothetical protein
MLLQDAAALATVAPVNCAGCAASLPVAMIAASNGISSPVSSRTC